jgi:rhodanese-related sulfurtransferase
MSATTAAIDPGIPGIDRAELKRRLRDPALTIVNVLPPEAFRAGRIPGSINLPVRDTPDRAASLLPDRAREIVVYCAAET